MNAIVKAPAPQPMVSATLIPQNMDQAMKLAQIMASSKMVPKHIQGDAGTCYMIVEQAQRWNMSPFAVAQCTSNISGKLCYEGKLIAASVSSTGAITGEFDYEYSGDPLKPDTLSVTASAVRSSDGQRKEIVLRWADAKTDNKYWRLQPEQQLCYAASRVWARRWTPGPLLGVYAPEEMDVRDNYEGTTIQATAEPIHAEPMGTRDAINASVPITDAPKRQTIAEWLDVLEAEFKAAHDTDAVDAILARADVQKAQDALKNGARERLNAMIKAAMDRTNAGWEPGADVDADETQGAAA